MGTPIRTVAQQLSIDTSLAGPITMPLSAVHSIVFQPCGDQLRRDQWTMPTAVAPPDTDQLILVNDDTVTGTVVAIDQGHRVETLHHHGFGDDRDGLHGTVGAWLDRWADGTPELLRRVGLCPG